MSNTPESRGAAQAALTAYTSVPGFRTDDTETSVVDLIADLLLLAESKGLDFEEIARLGLLHTRADLDPNDPFSG